MLSTEMEDYLKTIYLLQQETEGRVKTSPIAKGLGVSAPSVTAMLKKLDEQELADYEEYKGVTLTPDGEVVALEVIRHHRLLEAFLANQLDYDWSQVHDEADRLEHHISERFAERIAELLNHPIVDPHGDPIPGPELETVEQRPATRLSDFDEGETVRIERIGDQRPVVLTYLDDSGVEPGVVVEIVEYAPFGMVTVLAEGRSDQVSLPDHIAEHIFALPEDT